MDSMIWPVMPMNGVRIGIVKTVVHQLSTWAGHRQILGVTGCVAWSYKSNACAWPTASTTLRLIGTTTSGFDVCQDWNNMENGLIKASAVPQNKKGRTITFRVNGGVG